MRITIETQYGDAVNRKASVFISRHELANVHLHMAGAKSLNRTDAYMRRHDLGQGPTGVVGPNAPLRSEKDALKKPISDHIDEMTRAGEIPGASAPVSHDGETFGQEPAMLATTISDLTANLMRPCFHREGLGGHRVFHFDGEPVSLREYWCVCVLERNGNSRTMEFKRIRFDTVSDCALDGNSRDLSQQGLVWAAALVPLLWDGQSVCPSDIARHDYDLRQIIGRENETDIRYAYEGWFDEWDVRVREVTERYAKSGKPFEVFFHNVLALDREGNIHIRQEDGALPDLARQLEKEGMVAAGLLDSGGSCALYDVWMRSYLNHGWYFREPRGAILVFELKSCQRIPKIQRGSWFLRRKGD